MRHVALIAATFLLAPSGWGQCAIAGAQEPPKPSPLRPVRTYGLSVPLYAVRDVASSGERVVVLTRPDPAIHVFEEGEHREFGVEGRGPGELSNPVGVEVEGDEILVLDAFPGSSRILRWSAEGRLLDDRPLRSIGFVTQVSVSGQYVAGRSTDLGRNTLTIMRIRPNVDTLITFSMMKVQDVTASEGPTRRYPVPLPFQSTVAWALLENGDVAIWDPVAGVLTFAPPEGRERTAPLNLARIEVHARDREEWFEATFPSDFLGRSDDPLRAIRSRARELIEFPDSLPAVLDMLGDPEGGVWLKRTPASQGEVWVHIGRGAPTTVRFPVGREVRDFGSGYVSAWAREARYDTEVVELYRRADVEAAATVTLPSKDARR